MLATARTLKNKSTSESQVRLYDDLTRSYSCARWDWGEKMVWTVEMNPLEGLKDSRQKTNLGNYTVQEKTERETGAKKGAKIQQKNREEHLDTMQLTAFQKCRVATNLRHVQLVADQLQTCGVWKQLIVILLLQINNMKNINN